VETFRPGAGATLAAFGMNIREFAREALPPALFRAMGRASGRSVRYVGHGTDWQAAASASSGYAEALIVERVARATREVLAGRAAFERDSVLFLQPEVPLQLLAPLLRHAVQHPGRLEVIDFGGALGGIYRQCRPFLAPLRSLRWHVVEQPGFVAAGREFQTAELQFHESLDALPPMAPPPLLLASSVLQYLPDPASMLDAWAASPATTLVVDRTPLSEAAEDRVYVQHVPSHIYRASYPCWAFAREALLTRLSRHWRLVAEFDCPEGRHRVAGGGQFDFKGLILERAAS
jgi:putative methyltransferase (TIGR04325 family)